MDCRITPLRDRVIVSRDDAEVMSKGGIIIPTGAQEKPRFGTILAIGEGTFLPSGEVQRPRVKVGDQIVFGKFAGTEFTLDGESYLILKEEDILGVLKEPASTDSCR